MLKHVSKRAPAQGGYAIPPLDSEQNWAWRKKVFMEAVNSREAAEKYLAGMDATFEATLSKLGADGAQFSMWNVINECVHNCTCCARVHACRVSAGESSHVQGHAKLKYAHAN